ncbi:peroxiredoxin [Jannaschia sp. M317]|uniref:peroxiredoxin n=1 Tax=Jannaschia sp. M317 TaxID=2867011 RepID=UPI0021A973CE|nr:peroxiredoxin [Jannaschia sp. M317]UWQ18499.1 peroxiredoxin [Jannaschia sp. M317]
MTITTGDRLPEATLLRIGDDGPEGVALSELTAGKTVVLFGLPGAFTGTCTTAHVPSFIRTKDAFAEKGVVDIICFAVNDPHVMKAWAEATGAEAAGLHMLGDSDGALTKALGLDFDAPAAGFHGRTTRCAMLVEDGTVKVLHLEQGRGICEATAGEAMLAEV